jgi:hypothetical protein
VAEGGESGELMTGDDAVVVVWLVVVVAMLADVLRMAWLIHRK